MTAPGADWSPLDAEDHERQLAGLRDLLADPPQRILDIGAGGARIAAPLRDAGHHVCCIDNDPAAIDRCRTLGLDARCADALDPRADLAPAEGSWDAVLILGHTLLLFHDPVATHALLRRLRDVIHPDGALIADDPADLWRDVADGAWQAGLSEDGDAQLVWADGDNVIALRSGDAIDPDDDRVRERDRPMRLWSAGELRLLAHTSGWAPPERLPGPALIRLRPA